MVVVKSELLRSKAGERLCGTARTCGLPALELTPLRSSVYIYYLASADVLLISSI